MIQYVCVPGEVEMDSFKKKSDSLFDLIKKVSDYYGGDDVEWLRKYTNEVIKNNSEDIDRAIECFKSLI